MDITPEVRARLRTELQDFEPYDPAFTPCAVNLSANENTHKLSSVLQTAFTKAAAATALNRYPDPMSRKLQSALADWHGVKPSQICVGNGGDELLFNFLFAFGGLGKVLLTCPPDFSEYKNFAIMCSVSCHEIPRNQDTYDLDEQALLAAAPSADLIILTTPNNPTGNMLNKHFLKKLLETTKALVLVDEAYVEFAGEAELLGEDVSCISLIQKYPQLLVLRTFSKAFSMAGLRVGYIVAHESLIAAFSAVRQIYSEDVLAQALAYEALVHKDEFIAAIKDIVQERTWLYNKFTERARYGPRVWPSSANFLLVKIPHASQVRARLRDEYSILVRDFSSAPYLCDCLRISIGTHAENKQVLTALDALLS